MAMSKQKQKSQVWSHTLAGTGAGVVEVTLMQPLDVLKTRFQSSRLQGDYQRVLSSFVRMVKTEGIKSLYRGTIPVLAIVTPRVSLQFTGLAFFKPIFEQMEGKFIPQQSSAALAGVCTGLVQAVGLVTPLELLKVRQQTDLSGKYSTQFGTIRHIFKEEGIFAFYKGLLPTIVRQSWGLAIKFSCYTHIKSMFEDPSDPSKKLSPWKHMASGGLANVIVGVLNSPPDVVKTRMQDQNSSYKTSWECSKMMLKQEGISSFFRGAWLRVLRIAPGGAIQFAAYEYFVTLLEDRT